MRIAYISPSSLSDLDISQMSEAQKVMDITYYIVVTPNTKQRAAINLTSLNNEFGIYCAINITELSKYSSLLDLSKVFVVYYTSTRSWKFQGFVQSLKFYKHLNHHFHLNLHRNEELSFLSL